MIDFHSHILPNIDDGSRSFENSIQILTEAKKAGFTKIISTSHYIEDYYNCNESVRTQLLDELQTKINGLELYLGSEIYITEQIVQLILDGQASTINGSKYVLFELPLNTKPLNVQEVIYRLIENGLVPVIAHPERYPYVQENLEYMEELYEMGVLFQANYGSIVGLYGKKAEKTIKKCLKKDLIHFFGSDVHRTNQVYELIPKALKKICKIVGEEKLQELTTTNAQKVLNNEDIE